MLVLIDQSKKAKQTLLLKYNLHIMIQVFGHSVTYIFPFMFMLLLFLFVSSGFPATDLFMSHIETTETLKTFETMRKSFETCLMWFRTTDSWESRETIRTNIGKYQDYFKM